MSNQITYIKVGGSYQLIGCHSVKTSFRPIEEINTPRLRLKCDGLLTASDGYCWDGVSGPVTDRKTNMRAGLFHDSLYQLMRMGLLSHSQWREADGVFADILKEDGAWGLTIKIDLAGLRLARGKFAHPRNRKKRFTAP
jgi:hypothetical protein